MVDAALRWLLRNGRGSGAVGVAGETRQSAGRDLRSHWQTHLEFAHGLDAADRAHQSRAADHRCAVDRESMYLIFSEEMNWHREDKRGGTLLNADPTRAFACEHPRTWGEAVKRRAMVLAFVEENPFNLLREPSEVMKQVLHFLSLLSLSLLSACGGGSDSGGAAALISGLTGAKSPTTSPASTTPVVAGPTVVNSGAVSTPFVRGTTARYQLLGVGTQSHGTLSDSEQAISGAMTKLNDATLSGNSATREISGDATFALGRWIAGTVSTRSGAEMLTGTDNRAYHYVALNALEKLPATGKPTCDTGIFTAPTYVGDSVGAPANGTVSGSATLNFGGEGAVVDGSLKVSVGDAIATASLSTKIASPTSTSITGVFLSGGPGAAVQLGDHGDGAYVLAAGYAVTFPSGARYSGIAKFRCA